MSLLSNAALEGSPGRPAPGRIGAIDVARGVAVAAMAVYHLAWDLSEFQLIATEVTAEPGWRAFARVIASSFLLLVGVGLALAHRGGIRWRPFRRRLGTLAGAAAIVTVATSFLFPESYIFFGILHAIALGSLLALPLTQAPAAAAALAGLAFGIAPLVLTQPAFDAPLLAFLGLGGRVPVTNDWVPVFPWIGAVFAGIALAKLWRRHGGIAPGGVEGRLGRALAWAGRHSLVIYLLHQPVLYGAVAAVASVTGPNPAAQAAPFLRSCAASCEIQGQPEAVCRATCICTVDELRRGPVWAKVAGSGGLSPEEGRELGRVANACFARSR